MSLFPKKHLSLPKQNELEICVFGPGYGESIVIHIPGIGWGVIDSCVGNANGESFVVPLQYLIEILKPNFPKLAFVLLTHPHEDHYKGLDKVIDEYPGGSERICYYSGRSVRDLKVYIAQQKIALRNVLP
jgi:glyoxylase-like metal-dependent hydrolase (beta-lactamase superfamily II)